MMSFLALFLAHLLGDYIFQTNWVYRQKQKGLIGGIPHAIGIFIAMACVFFPYFGQLWPIFLVIALLHFFQDSGKVFWDLHGENARWKSYFVDQGAHLLTLFLGNLLILRSGSIDAFWIPQEWLLFSILFLITTKTWDITKHVFTNPKALYVPEYSSMLVRGGVVICGFSLFLFFV